MLRSNRRRLERGEERKCYHRPAMNRHICIAVLVVACGKDTDQAKNEKAPDPPKAVEPAKPPPKQAKTTAAALGKTPAAPFGKAAKLTIGMSEADAKAAAPEFFGASGPQEVDSAEDALKFSIGFDRGRLTKIVVKSTSYDNLEKLAAEAWGPGTRNKATMGEEEAWFDPKNHTRAVADSSEVELSEYVPLDELLGPGVELAAFPKPIVGVTFDDLKTSYPANVKPEDTKHLFFPPTEWGRADMDTHLFLLFRKNKVTNYQFDVRDNGGDAAKEAALASFKKKWGEPKLLKPYGSDRESMVFHKKKPLIEINRDVDNKSWNVQVRAVDDACGGPCYKGL